MRVDEISGLFFVDFMLCLTVSSVEVLQFVVVMDMGCCSDMFQDLFCGLRKGTMI